LAIFVIVYMSIEVCVALVLPQRIFQIGDMRCFDDWCISVEKVETAESIGREAHPSRGRFLLVTLRVASHARRVRQSARDALVYLVDDAGNRYDVDDAAQAVFERLNGQQTPLSAMLDPQTSFVTVRVFDIPPDLKGIGLAVRHGSWPGWFIIGDDGSFLRKTPVFVIPINKG